MDKFVGVIIINPSPLAMEQDFNGHGNKNQNTCDLISFKYNTGMKLAGQKFQREISQFRFGTVRLTEPFRRWNNLYIITR